jgi:pimeloyl-ACP methyl ester carboxylesterase
MAADAVGLLDALEIPTAHVVGASMGGFIAQLVALNHPEHVLSLTSIMSGPNGDDQVEPTPEGAAVLLIAPAPTREERIEQAIWVREELMGPDDEFDEKFERARAASTIDRSYYPPGFGRQFVAILAAASRVERLRSLQIPTLVIHGTADILIPIDNGRIVAGAVPNATLLKIEGMGHDLPKRVWTQVADAIADLARLSTTAC